MGKSTLVNLEMLDAWKTEMDRINTSALEVINDVSNTLQELEEEWKGDSATAFLGTFDEKIKEVRLVHEKMAQISNMFHVVAETTSNQ